MITINFEAQIGYGIRQRVIQPALLQCTRPVLIVSAHRDMLHCNWPDIPPEQKMTLSRFLMEASSGTLDYQTLVVMEELLPVAWKRIDTQLAAIRNEIWTINRNVR